MSLVQAYLHAFVRREGEERQYRRIVRLVHIVAVLVKDKVCRICVVPGLVKEAGQRLAVHGQRLVLQPGALHEYSTKFLKRFLSQRLSRSVTKLCLALTVPARLPALVQVGLRLLAVLQANNLPLLCESILHACVAPGQALLFLEIMQAAWYG